MKSKTVPMPDELAARVDDYRFERRIKTDADAIRQLIERGLEAAKAERGGEDGARA